MYIQASQSSSGRSPFADQIYAEYLASYQHINEKIDLVNQQIGPLPFESEQRAALLEAVRSLQILQGSNGESCLYDIYYRGYTGAISYEQFSSLKGAIELQVDRIAAGTQSPQATFAALEKKAEDLLSQINGYVQNGAETLVQKSDSFASIDRELQALLSESEAHPEITEQLHHIQTTIESLKKQLMQAQIEFENLRLKQQIADQYNNTLVEQGNRSEFSEEDIRNATAIVESIAQESDEAFAIEADFMTSIQQIGSFEEIESMIADCSHSLHPYVKEIQQILDQANGIAYSVEGVATQKDAELENLQKKLFSWENSYKALFNLAKDHPEIGGELSQIKSLINSIAIQIESLTHQLESIRETSTSIQSDRERIAQFGALLDPNEADRNQAGLILETVKRNQQMFTESLSQYTESMASIIQLDPTSKIAALEKTLSPPSSVRVENAVWYIDWTSWGDPSFPIPEGVDTVNLFVGQLTLNNGVASIGGFGNFTPEKIQAFVDACHAKGIAVKASLGGGGGSYDRCWDLLTENNIDQFAQGIVQYCKNFGIDGVDFDYEEFGSTAQEVLVGRLIKACKDINPEFQTSICTNAGFSTWKGIVETIFDAAMGDSGVCSIDRLYVMSYYDPLQNEKQWMLEWSQWLKEKYGFTNAQITVGLDDFDAHAYSIAEFAQWAKDQGFSTGYWAWNPATVENSNRSSETIWEIYHE